VSFVFVKLNLLAV